MKRYLLYAIGEIVYVEVLKEKREIDSTHLKSTVRLMSTD